MNVSLTPELENMINEKVESGMYNSASEVVREALRLLRERDEVKERRLEQLRKEITVGLEQLRRGESIPGEQVAKEIEEIKARGRRRLAKERGE